MDWYYEKDNQQNGPVPVEDLLALLESREISRDTLVWRDGLDGWQPLHAAGVLMAETGEEMAVCAYSGAVRPKSEMIPYGDRWVLPEHRDAFVQSLMSGTQSEGSTGNLVPDDYTVPIGACFSRGWQSLTADFWPNIGASAIVFGIYFALSSIPYLGSLAGFIQVPIYGGLYWYFLLKVRGQRPEISAVFYGFSQPFLQLFLLGLVVMLIVLAAMIPGGVAFGVGIALTNNASTEIAGGVLVGLGILLFLIPAMYLQVAWMFAPQLCIDRKLDFWPAMLTSMRTVNKHWFLCFLFSLVAGLLVLAGILALCLGIFIAAPWIFLSLTHLYEHVYGRQRAEEILST